MFEKSRSDRRVQGSSQSRKPGKTQGYLVQLCKRWCWLGVLFLWACGSAAGPLNGGPTSQAAPFKSPVTDALVSANAQPNAEEADLYRTRGHLLFYLHKYKGLTIFDLQDPKQPKKLSGVPVFGEPVEMFVDEKMAYVLVTKPITASRVGAKMPYLMKIDNAQLITIDISNPSQAKIVGRLALRGDLRRGQARKIGATIYLVAHDEKAQGQLLIQGVPRSDNKTSGTRELLAIDVSQPAKPVELKRTTIGEGTPARLLSPHQGDTADPKVDLRKRTTNKPTFHGIVITASADRLLLTERWSVQSTYETSRLVIQRFRTWSGGCTGASRETEQRRLEPVVFTIRQYYSIVNVYSPSQSGGQLLNRIAIAGVLGDQFKQSAAPSKGSNKTLYFGIVRRNVLKLSETEVTSAVQNIIISAEVAENLSLGAKLLSTLTFGKPDETVRGSYFDHSRNVAYAITATGVDAAGEPVDKVKVDRSTVDREILRSWDPLYAIDLTDPNKLRSLSDIDGLSGDVNLFRPIAGGKFLLAVGRDTSPSCTGFDQGSGFSRTSISLIDARDLTKLRLVQRKCVSVKHGLGNITSSAVNWDRDQAHKMIGLYTDSDTNVVSVPVSFAITKGGKEETKIAVGLMRWDLSKYDDTLAPDKQNVLENLGTVLHPTPQLDRTILMKLPQGGAPHLAMVNLSQDALTVTGLQDASDPQSLAQVPLSSFTDAFYRFGDHMIEVVLNQTSGDLNTHLGNTQQSRSLLIRRWNADAPQAQPILLTMELGEVAQVLRHGTKLLVFRTVRAGETLVEIWNLEDPMKPQLVKKVSLLSDFSPAIHSDFDGQAKGINQWLLTKQGLIYATFTHGVNTVVRLRWLSLEKPEEAAVELLKVYELPGDSHIRLMGTESGGFAMGIKSNENNTQRYQLVHWNWQANKWNAGETLPLPGDLLQSWEHEGQQYFVTTLGGDINKFRQVTLLRRVPETKQYTIIDTIAWSEDARSGDIRCEGDNLTLRLPTGINQYKLTAKGFSLEHTTDFNTTGVSLIKATSGGLLLQLGGKGVFLLPQGKAPEGEVLRSFVPLYLWQEHYNSRTRQTTSAQVFTTSHHFFMGKEKLWFAAGAFGILSFNLPAPTAP